MSLRRDLLRQITAPVKAQLPECQRCLALRVLDLKRRSGDPTPGNWCKLPGKRRLHLMPLAGVTPTSSCGIWARRSWLAIQYPEEVP